MANSDRRDAAPREWTETADARTVVARSVLLDALTALTAHLSAIVLVGAQAVYLHTGQGDLSVASYTFDADLVVNPDLIGDVPLLEQLMHDAGFTLSSRRGVIEPGMWVTTRRAGIEDVLVPVDLIVPEAYARARGRRSARIGAHGRTSLRWTHGLEAVVVDHRAMSIGALDPNDGRHYQVEVAGPAALLVAKLHKLHDRFKPGERPDRLRDKDASDVYRLMQTFPAGELASTLVSLESHPQAGPVTTEAIVFLEELFIAPQSPGTNMAAAALAAVIPDLQVRTYAAAWTAALLGEVRRAS